MATNPYINKVIFGQNTLIDISDSNVVESDVAVGKKFYKADGSPAIGIASDSNVGSATVGGSVVADGPELQEKTVTPTRETQIITPDQHEAIVDLDNVQMSLRDNYQYYVDTNVPNLIAGQSYHMTLSFDANSAGKYSFDDDIEFEGFYDTTSQEYTLQREGGGTAKKLRLYQSGEIRIYTAGARESKGDLTLSITSTVYYDALSKVTVYGYNPVLQSKTATPTESSQVIEADSGYDGLDQVSVGAIASDYVGSGVTRRTSSDLTASGATVTAPAGFYASQATKTIPSGTEGTPTATKGTVSNHSVTVTPSVTNIGGYIAGSTKSGTAVTVTASELVSGNKAITENGTNIDVTNYATVSVDVQGGGSAAIIVDTLDAGGGTIRTITTTEEYRVQASKTVTPTSSVQVITPDQGYDALASVTVNAASGGGGDGGGNIEDDVVFIDYDGTVLHSYSASDFQALSAMPANPSHSGLTAQGWNWSLADAKAQVTSMGRCIIGQTYVTDDGKTRLYCHFEDGALSPYLGICVNGTVTVDWGDNSSTDTLTGNSYTTVKTVQHVYSSSGDYIITISSPGTNGFAFYGVANNTYLLRRDTTTTTAGVHRAYSNALRKVELGTGAVVSSYAFNYCGLMESITIRSDLSAISQYAFRGCHSLRSCVIPPLAQDITQYSFSSCPSLSILSIPKSVTSVITYAFSGAWTLTHLALPSTLTTFQSYIFNNCYCLFKLIIPPSVDSIGMQAFSACYSIVEYHLKPTTPPTLASTSAFTNINPDCKIYVPYSADHSVLNAYQTANNWSTLSQYIVEEPT